MSKDIRNNIRCYEFLRRVAIFQHFCLNIPLTSLDDQDLLDWNHLLSISYLKEYFEIEFDEFVTDLPVFSGISLPEEFICVYQHPCVDCSVPSFFECKNSVFLDLLSGQTIALHEGSLAEALTSKCEAMFGVGPAFVLALTGPVATAAYFVTRDSGCIPISPFYLDALGDGDKGFRYLTAPRLSSLRYCNAVDSLLSGSFMNRSE
jgi:hypothetical protein